MRYTLGIDTAAPDGSVALAADGRAVAEEPLLPREHSSGLSLAVERLLASRSIGLGDLTGVAVSEGPGSFTGLRIGLAWAKGVALGAAVPLVLVSSHEALAHGRTDDDLAWTGTILPSERGHAELAVWRGRANAPAWGPATVNLEELFRTAAFRAAELVQAMEPYRFGARLELRPATKVLEAALLDDPFLEEDMPAWMAVISPSPVAGAVAEIGDRKIADGIRADLILAAPAYGREPNARKPGS